MISFIIGMIFAKALMLMKMEKILIFLMGAVIGISLFIHFIIYKVENN